VRFKADKGGGLWEPPCPQILERQGPVFLVEATGMFAQSAYDGSAWNGHSGQSNCARGVQPKAAVEIQALLKLIQKRNPSYVWVCKTFARELEWKATSPTKFVSNEARAEPV